MAQTPEEKRIANNKAVAEHHKLLMLFKVQPRKEEGKVIKDYAQAAGLSVQKLFLQSVREYMARHSANNDTLAAIDVSAECVVEISPEMYAKAQMSANYRKMSIREYVELSINEQRIKDVREIQAAVMKNEKK